jgi:hypothetical protein
MSDARGRLCLSGIVRQHERMKALFIVLILVEIVLTVLVFTPPLVDRRALASAVMAYHQDPSQEHLRERQFQHDVTRQIAFRLTLSVGVLLVANSFGLLLVGRRLRHVQTTA